MKLRKIVLQILLTAGTLFCLAGCGKAEEAMDKGLAQLEEKDYEAAAASFEQAWEEDAWYDGVNKRDALLYRGEALMGAGEYEKALYIYKGQMNEDQKDSRLFYGAGMACLMLEQYPEAKDHFLKAEELGDQNACEYAGRAAEADGAYEEAEACYERALEKQPESSLLHLQIGKCRIENGDYEGALQILEEGIRQGDTDMLQQLLYQQAVCYEYMQDYETARNKMQAYVEQYPQDEAAKKEYEFLLTR